MSAALSIYDETVGAGRHARFTLHLASERITVREIIERRVREEVAAYNRNREEHYFGLVQPTDAEQMLNGYRMRTRRLIDEREQCARALEAFQRNGFIVLVRDRQVESLDDEVVLGEVTEVTFLKLMPLVGG